MELGFVLDRETALRRPGTCPVPCWRRWLQPRPAPPPRAAEVDRAVVTVENALASLPGPPAGTAQPRGFLLPASWPPRPVPASHRGLPPPAAPPPSGPRGPCARGLRLRICRSGTQRPGCVEPAVRALISPAPRAPRSSVCGGGSPGPRRPGALIGEASAPLMSEVEPPHCFNETLESRSMIATGRGAFGPCHILRPGGCHLGGAWRCHLGVLGGSRITGSLELPACLPPSELHPEKQQVG